MFKCVVIAITASLIFCDPREPPMTSKTFPSDCNPNSLRADALAKINACPFSFAASTMLLRIGKPITC